MHDRRTAPYAVNDRWEIDEQPLGSEGSTMWSVRLLMVEMKMGGQQGAARSFLFCQETEPIRLDRSKLL